MCFVTTNKQLDSFELITLCSTGEKYIKLPRIQQNKKIFEREKQVEAY